MPGPHPFPRPAARWRVTQPRCIAVPRPGRPGPLHGLGLVEVLVALALLGVLVTAAVPSLAAAADRRRLATMASEAGAVLQAARGAALARGEAVRIVIAGGSGGAQCLLVHAGPAGSCGCDGPAHAPFAACTEPSHLVAAMALAAGRDLSLGLPVPAVRIDPWLGTVTPTATLRVAGRHGAVHHTLNLMGRVRSCTPAPTPGITGWPPC